MQDFVDNDTLPAAYKILCKQVLWDKFVNSLLNKI
jgi:hypothetical protein